MRELCESKMCAACAIVRHQASEVPSNAQTAHAPAREVGRDLRPASKRLCATRLLRSAKELRPRTIPSAKRTAYLSPALQRWESCNPRAESRQGRHMNRVRCPPSRRGLRVDIKLGSCRTPTLGSSCIASSAPKSAPILFPILTSCVATLRVWLSQQGDALGGGRHEEPYSSFDCLAADAFVGQSCTGIERE